MLLCLNSILIILLTLTLKKLAEHIASGAFVCPSFRPFIRSSCFLVHSITLELCMLLFYFSYRFLMKKIADTYLFLDRIMPLSWIMTLWKIWMQMKKIADTYFFLDRIMPLSWVMILWKNMDTNEKKKKNSWHVFFSRQDHAPFLSYDPLKTIRTQFCRQNISKSIKARALKLDK